MQLTAFVRLQHGTEEGCGVFRVTHTPYSAKPKHEATPTNLNFRLQQEHLDGQLHHSHIHHQSKETSPLYLHRASHGWKGDQGQPQRCRWVLFSTGREKHFMLTQSTPSAPIPWRDGVEQNLQRMETNRCRKLNSDRHHSALALQTSCRALRYK